MPASLFAREEWGAEFIRRGQLRSVGTSPASTSESLLWAADNRCAKGCSLLRLKNPCRSHSLYSQVLTDADCREGRSVRYSLRPAQATTYGLGIKAFLAAQNSYTHESSM